MTKKTITITQKYFNIPVNNQAPETKVIIRDLKNQNTIRYFSISLGNDEYDFIAYYDLSEFIDHEVEIETENIDDTTKLLTFLKQSDSPLGLKELYRENHRPQFHFSARRGWLNDPNGLFYYAGKYHMFFQHNPFAIRWGNMHWGHAVSEDLIHWRELGDVLCPDELGTMHSGSGVVDWNNTSGLQRNEHPPIMLFYTAAGRFSPDPKEYTQCMAYSTDGGETFVKYANNPVVGYTAVQARDPKVIWHEESQKWIMVLYNGDQAKTFLFLTSANLLDWQISHEIAFPGGRECPELFPMPLDGCEDNIKWIFMEANSRYLIGQFNGEKFEVEAGPYDSLGRYGEACAYAGQMWSNAPCHRKTIIHWQQGDCCSTEFNQTMTIPVDLSLKSFFDGVRLCAEPVKELKKLRGENWEFTNVEITSQAGTPEEFLDIPADDCWDIEFELDEKSNIFVNICGEDVALDAESRNIRISAATFAFPVDMKELKVRIIIDRSSIELFGAEGRIWYAKRRLTACTQPVLFPHQTCGNGLLKKVKIYRINSIW